MSVASQTGAAAKATSMRAAVDVAAATGRDGSSASGVARDRLIETIRDNVMAWTKWTVLDESALKFHQPRRVL